MHDSERGAVLDNALSWRSRYKEVMTDLAESDRVDLEKSRSIVLM